MEIDKKEKRVKRVFTEEFKVEAIELGKKLGSGKAGKELGISESLIRSWRKKFESSPSITQSKKSYEELERENKRLAKEIQYIKEINEVLKKSTAIFSSGPMGGLK